MHKDTGVSGGGMDTLITILARGGSKGVPNKALRLVNGKPLIQWTVEQALRCDCTVVISSDSEDIMAHFLGMKPKGAFLVWRPKELAQDDTPKLDAIRHAVNWTEGFTDKQYHTIIDLDICNPLRTADDIQKALQLFKDKKAQTVVSVTPARRSPYFNMVEMDETGAVWLFNTGYKVTRRQDIDPAFDLNCSIYVYDRDWLVNPNNISPLQADCYAYVMQPWQFCDIDNEVDFKVCEFLMKEYMHV